MELLGEREWLENGTPKESDRRFRADGADTRDKA